MYSIRYTIFFSIVKLYFFSCKAEVKRGGLSNLAILNSFHKLKINNNGCFVVILQIFGQNQDKLLHSHEYLIRKSNYF